MINLFQEIDASEDVPDVCDSFPQQPGVDEINKLKDNFLMSAKAVFSSASPTEITIENATKFASTVNHGSVNTPAHLNSVKSTPQGINIQRSDPRVSHELFTLKVNTSKPQQPGAFVVEHTQKSSLIRKKAVVPFNSILGMVVDERKITMDISEPPKTFVKRKDESGAMSTSWSEQLGDFSLSGNGPENSNTRVEIQFERSNSFHSLIQSDVYLQNAISGGILLAYQTTSRAKLLEPEAFLPVANDAKTVRAAQLAVLDLLKQAERTSDVIWLIRMFQGIQLEFKKRLSDRMPGDPLLEKEE